MLTQESLVCVLHVTLDLVIIGRVVLARFVEDVTGRALMQVDSSVEVTRVKQVLIQCLQSQLIVREASIFVETPY